MNLDDKQIAALRAAAEAAMPGPWFVAHELNPIDAEGHSLTNHQDSRLPDAGHARSVANAVHIAAANPAVVLALLARLDRAEAVLRWIEEHDCLEAGEVMAEHARAYFNPPQEQSK